MEIRLEVLIPAGASPNDGQSCHCTTIKSVLIPGAGLGASPSHHPQRGVESPTERLCWPRARLGTQQLHKASNTLCSAPTGSARTPSAGGCHGVLLPAQKTSSCQPLPHYKCLPPSSSLGHEAFPSLACLGLKSPSSWTHGS